MVSAAELAIVLKAQDNASKVLGDVEGKVKGLGSTLGTALKVGALAGGAAIVGLGATMLKIAGDFDDAYDKIRVGTGATGQALEGLQGDFKSVFTSVPTDMGSASTAISELNTRLGLTGQPLQDLSKQFLELSRITGSDVKQNITSVTRAFGDWSLSTDDQGKALDTLFKVSQATGPSVDALASKVVQFGAPMRQMGFSFEETAVLMGQFEKQGVNTELVMGSMRMAIGKFAKDNIPMRQGLEDTIKSIQTMGPSAKSTALAMEVFGARAGADMADTILSGKFAIDDWLNAVEGGQETIMGAAADTQDFGEKFTLLKNKILVAVEPLATRMMGALTAFATLLLDKVAPAISTFVNGIVAGFRSAGQEFGFLESGQKKAAMLGNALGIVAQVVKEDVLPALQSVIPWLKDLGKTALKMGKDILQDIVIPAIVSLKQGWDDLRPSLQTALDILKPIWRTLSDHKEIIIILAATILLLTNPWLLVVAALVVVLAKWDEIKKLFTVTIPQAIDSVITKIKELPIIGAIFTDTFNTAFIIVKTMFGLIKTEVETAINVVRDIIRIVTALIHGDWDEAWKGIKQLVTDIWNGIKEVIETLLNGIKDLIGTKLELIKTVMSDAWGLIDGKVKEVWGGITGAVESAVNAVKDLALDMATFVLEKIRDLFQKAKDVADAFPGPNPLGNAMQSAINKMNQTIDGMKAETSGRMDGLAGSAMGGLSQGLWNRLPSVLAAIDNVTDSMVGTMRAGLQAASPSKVMIGIGQDVMNGLHLGMTGSFDRIKKVIIELNAMIANAAGEDVRAALVERVQKLMADVGGAVSAGAAAIAGGSAGGGAGPTVNTGTSPIAPTSGAPDWFKTGALDGTVIAGLAKMRWGNLTTAQLSEFSAWAQSAFDYPAGNNPLVALLNNMAGQGLQNAGSVLQILGQGGQGLIDTLRSKGLAFERGGIVPGQIGAPQLIVAHGGETITPNGGGSVNVTFQVQSWDSRDVERWLEQNAGMVVSKIRRELSRAMA